MIKYLAESAIGPFFLLDGQKYKIVLEFFVLVSVLLVSCLIHIDRQGLGSDCCYLRNVLSICNMFLLTIWAHTHTQKKKTVCDSFICQLAAKMICACWKFMQGFY